MKFEIKVRETYQKTYIIEAEDEDEATEIMNGKEVEMDNQDYVDNSYHVHSIKKLKDEGKREKKFYLYCKYSPKLGQNLQSFPIRYTGKEPIDEYTIFSNSKIPEIRLRVRNKEMGEIYWVILDTNDMMCYIPEECFDYPWNIL